MKKKFWVVLYAIMALILAACGGGSVQDLTREQAEEQLKSNISNDLSYSTVSHTPNGNWAGSDESAIELPPIDKYELAVHGNGEINVEIFSSTEKSNVKDRRWLDIVAEAFNNANVIIDGKHATVSVRPMESGLALDYIRSRKPEVMPDAYSPSNELWAELVKSSGVNAQMIDDRLAGNVAGVLMEQGTYDSYTAKYGAITVDKLIEASLAGDLKLGHTNPNLSSTGLNFLTQELMALDPSNPLSAEAGAKFSQFQTTVPQISPNTDHLARIAAKGQANAVIMEAQARASQPTLSTGWVFEPIGVRHDSPLYAIGDLPADKLDTLQQFAAFATSDANQQLAATYGFNQYNDYPGVDNQFNGQQLESALTLWKQNKDGGRPVISMIVVDRSGSMAGSRLVRVKEALGNAAGYINTSNYVGLISYASDVTVDVPIGKFDNNQRSLFMGAVNDLQADGGTATNSAIQVGLHLMLQKAAEVPNAKLRIIVMSDGEQNQGASLNDTISIAKGLGVPVYGVGFDAQLSDLEKLAESNDGYVINADIDDVGTRLKDLFNAEL